MAAPSDDDDVASSPAAVPQDPLTSSRVARGKGVLWLLLRLGFTTVLLWLLVRRISIEELGGFFARTVDNWPWLATALIMPAVGFLISSLRLRCLLHAQDAEVRTTELLTLNLVSSFYNQVLPSTIGADVVRTFWLSRVRGLGGHTLSKGGRLLIATTVIGADRILGAVGIFATALLASALDPSIVASVPALRSLSPLIVIGALLVVAIPFIPTRRFGVWVFSGRLLRRLRDKAATIYRALNAYRRSPRELFAALLLSIALQVTIIIQYWLLANALQLGNSLQELAILIPIVTAISMIPITINGIGLRENALVTLGAPLGFTAGSAVALGWAFVTVKILWALLGGLLQLKYRQNRKTMLGSD